MLQQAKEIRYLRRNLRGLERMRLHYAKAPKAPRGAGRRRKARS